MRVLDREEIEHQGRLADARGHTRSVAACPRGRPYGYPDLADRPNALVAGLGGRVELGSSPCPDDLSAAPSLNAALEGGRDVAHGNGDAAGVEVAELLVAVPG